MLSVFMARISHQIDKKALSGRFLGNGLNHKKTNGKP